MSKPKEIFNSVLLTAKLATEAIKMELDRMDAAQLENDRYPLNIFEKFAYVISQLHPDRLKELIVIMKSLEYGGYILNCVFPKYDNPEEFHSRDGKVYFGEHPVQVLGWKEEEDLIEEGIQSGLLREWVEAGLWRQAEVRGIDLEWSFFEFPPSKDGQPSPVKKSKLDGIEIVSLFKLN